MREGEVVGGSVLLATMNDDDASSLVGSKRIY